MRKSGHANEVYVRNPIAMGTMPHKYPVVSPSVAKNACARDETATNAKKRPMNLACPMRRSTAASGMKSRNAYNNAILPDVCTNGKVSAFSGADRSKPYFSAMLALVYQKSRYLEKNRIA